MQYIDDPGLGYRHVFLMMACLGGICLYGMRVNLSVAIVTMVNSTTVSNSNQTISQDDCGDDTLAVGQVKVSVTYCYIF